MAELQAEASALQAELDGEVAERAMDSTRRAFEALLNARRLGDEA